MLSLDVSSDVLMISETGMCIRFHADQVPAMGRVSGGVKGMTLDPSDRILWVGQPAAADQLLLLTERGFGKRVPYTDYEPQARGGKGVKTFYYQKSGSNGHPYRRGGADHRPRARPWSSTRRPASPPSFPPTRSFSNPSRTAVCPTSWP